MATESADSSVLLVRAWRQPDGPVCARVGVVSEPWLGPSAWRLCVDTTQTLLVVRSWLVTGELEAVLNQPHSV
jgi:hypothetical protein